MKHSKKPMWLPDESNSSLLGDYIDFLEINHNLGINNYSQLHQWSIDCPVNFWSSFADFASINFAVPPSTVLSSDQSMINAKWFVDAELNFAEHLLPKKDASTAIIYRDETGRRKELSYRELNEKVSSFAHALIDQGVGKGDVVAGIITNSPEAIIAMIATSSLGAIWTSCSPDFGTDAILDRVGQVKPKVLIAIDQYNYGGKTFNLIQKIASISSKLESLTKIFIVQNSNETLEHQSIKNSVLFNDYLDCGDKLVFDSFPFDHPLYIMYSSGTTGKPKCILHSAGGTLIQHMKEHQLHLNLRPKERLFFFTTCGWMMWNWLASALASKATIILYEGSPFYPKHESLWEIAEEENITHFGISPGYISTLMKNDAVPAKKHKLQSLKTVLSTGSPLLADHFQYIQKSIKDGVQISSISGGTDIISCFVLGNPMTPVFKGEIQSIGLGMDVRVFTDNGKEAQREEKGELVCTQPFPSMPIGFFNDPGKRKYKQSYFSSYENIWAHGDFATITNNGGVIIYGRSDATLNSKGIRIGTAEIYRQTEKFSEILEAVVVETNDNSESTVTLFLKLDKDKKLTEELIEQIKHRLKIYASPKHVPTNIIQVDDIPKTISGKISELSVKSAIEGKKIKNIEALSNPDSLIFFKQFAKEN